LIPRGLRICGAVFILSESARVYSGVMGKYDFL
jgi:hypothetical protein